MSSCAVSPEEKATILVVDDDSTNLAVFGQFLMTTYTVLVAMSGARALEILQNDPKPDLILLDIMMPEMDGYEVISRLKESTRTRDIPVIFLTALTSAVDESRGLELGAVDYIYKPCNLAILSARIRTHIELKRAREFLRNQNAILEAELDKRVRENQLFQLELIQSEKLAAIGQLAAGIAHQINNPLGFIFSNFNTLKCYFSEIFCFFDQLYALLEQSNISLDEIQKTWLDRQKHIQFIREDSTALVTETIEGLDRVRNIVVDLNKFSNGNIRAWQVYDVNKCLDATLNIFCCDPNMQCSIEKDYANIPEINCIPARLNQAFLSLLINASQAIGISGKITIRTGSDHDQVWVEIIDNGQGISAEDMPHLFEPFFTTRPIGKGVGLGLSMTEAIVQAHNGRIEVVSAPEQGSVFKIWLPIAGE